MSDSSLRPPPVRLGALRAGDLDTRGFNLAPDLSPAGATVAEIESIVVRRLDGEPISTGDLTVTPSGSDDPYLSSNSLVIYWWCTSDDALPERDYGIALTFTTSLGQRLTRDLLQLVVPRMG
jgi:hypothetical protein